MNAVVIHESLTGTTKKAGELIADQLTAAGIPTVACSTTAIDMQALSAADLVIVGSWTDGFVFVGQRPGRAGRLRRLPFMAGKQCIVYCTYAIDVGNTLDKLSAIVQSRGGDVLGGMAIRRDRVAADVTDFVERALGAVSA